MLVRSGCGKFGYNDDFSQREVFDLLKHWESKLLPKYMQDVHQQSLLPNGTFKAVICQRCRVDDSGVYARKQEGFAALRVASEGTVAMSKIPQAE